MRKKDPKKTTRCTLKPHENELARCLAIAKSIPGYIYWKNKEGVFLGGNDSFLQLTGLKSVVGKTDFDMPWVAYAEGIRQNDLEVINANRTQQVEEILLTPTGQVIPVLTSKTSLHDSKGEPIGIVGNSLDITQHNHALSTLLSNQEKTASTLENMVANMPGHVYWKDSDGVYLGCNNLQAQSLGFRYGYEIIGKTDFDLPWGEKKAVIFRQNDVAIMRTGKAVIVEEKAQVNGSEAVVLSHKSPIYAKNGEILGIMGISIDISAQKQLEDELRAAKELAESANAAKTEFLANMRHDIRTPLSGIVGFSEILKLESSEPHIVEYAENLVASSHALLNLMDDVLEAVRVSSGEIPMLKRKFHLRDTLEEMIALYAAKAHEKNLTLTLAIDPALPQYVIGDRIRFHRIALELVGNALNFTDSGGIMVNLTLTSHKKELLVIKIDVNDTGIGIPKEKQQDIYLQFKRLTPSYQGIYKGAGLGLFIVKQFIDEMRGEIYVSSEQGKGTCFTCLIPLQPSLLDDDFGVDKEGDLLFEKPYLIPLNQKPVIKGKKRQQTPAVAQVLVVDDNSIAQTVARALLSLMSCQVDTADSGMEALALCKQNHYDLIFMDIGLGEGLDGYEVTHHLRAHEKGAHIPIIALTAHGGEENKQRCIKAGMDAVLTKPLTQAHATNMLSMFIPARRPAALDTKQTLRRDLPDDNAELFELSQFALLDSKQALKSCGSQALFKELLLTLLTEEIPIDLAAMKRAFAEKNYAEVEKLAHKIKGGAVYVGTTRMKYACQYLERYWKTGELELFEALYQQMLTVIEETCLQIKDWLSKQ